MKAKPKSETHVRAAFHLSREVLGKLAALVGDLKADARAKGRPLPSQSEIVESALRAEIAKQRKKRR